MFYFNTNKPKIIFSLAKYWLYQKAKGPLRGGGGCVPQDPSTTSIPEGGPLSSSSQLTQQPKTSLNHQNHH